MLCILHRSTSNPDESIMLKGRHEKLWRDLNAQTEGQTGVAC